jgi:hypothetical protein
MRPQSPLTSAARGTSQKVTITKFTSGTVDSPDPEEERSKQATPRHCSPASSLPNRNAFIAWCNMNFTSIIFPDITNSDIVNEVYQYWIIHVTAYIVHIDLQLRNEVIFRLTPESIDYLTKYHNEIPLDISHLSEKGYQIRKSQFVPESTSLCIGHTPRR